MVVEMSVVQATGDELDDAVVVLRLFARHSANFPLAEDRMLNVLAWCITQGMCFLAYDENHNPVGIIAGHVTDHPFADKKVAVELAWYVHHTSSGNGFGRMLMEAFEQRAREHKVDWITFSTLASSPATEKSMDKAGYVAYETAWLKPTGE